MYITLSHGFRFHQKAHTIHLTLNFSKVPRCGLFNAAISCKASVFSCHRFTCRVSDPELIGNFEFQTANLHLAYAYDVGFSSLSATLSVSIYNCACTIGPVFIGALIDRLHTTTVLAIISTVSALAVFFLWGFAVHPSILYIFAIVWGVFAYGYSATWTGCARSIQKESPSSELAVIIGFLAAGRGIGAMVSGPISESLLNLDLWTGKFENAYGTRYGILIVFTGLTAFFGGFGVMNRFGTLKRYMQGAGSQSEETEPLIE